MNGSLALIELPDEAKNASAPMITIRTKKVSLDIVGASDELAIKLVKAVGHAI